MVGTNWCLLGRELAVDAISSDAGPPDAHHVVVIRKAWVKAVMTEIP